MTSTQQTPDRPRRRFRPRRTLGTSTASRRAPQARSGSARAEPGKCHTLNNGADGWPRHSVGANRRALYTPRRVPLQQPPVAYPLARSHSRARSDARSAPGRRRRCRRPEVRVPSSPVAATVSLTGPDRHRGARSDSSPDASRRPPRRRTDSPRRGELQEAGSVIANGYLRLDREEWMSVVEKRSAALQDRRV